MATIRQKQAIEKLVENGGNATQAMREVGYSEATVNNPQNLTKSKGFNETLAQYGLTEEFVVNALVEDIRAKPQHRLGELALASDIMGLRRRGLVIANQFLIENREIDKLPFIDVTNPRVLELMQEMNALLTKE